MICKLEFDPWGEAWKNLTQEQYSEVFSATTLPEKKDDVQWSTEVVVELDLIAPGLEKYKLEPKIKAFRNNQLTTMVDRISRLEAEHKTIQGYQDGGIVQFHIPNIGLLAINEVELLSDGCTDALQVMLNEGWSMLAICPPNAQRRPDYILGRFNPEKGKR